MQVDPNNRASVFESSLAPAFGLLWHLPSGSFGISPRALLILKESLRDCKQAVTLWQRSVAVPRSPSKAVRATCALVESTGHLPALLSSRPWRAFGTGRASATFLLERRSKSRHAEQSVPRECRLLALRRTYSFEKPSGSLREPCRGLQAVSACGQLRKAGVLGNPLRSACDSRAIREVTNAFLRTH